MKECQCNILTHTHRGKVKVKLSLCLTEYHAMKPGLKDPCHEGKWWNEGIAPCDQPQH